MIEKIIYLDNNATTSCAKEVVDSMLPFLTTTYGNASSGHYAGRMAYKAVEKARQGVANILDVAQHEIFFNSGATEGNNWIFSSLLRSNPTKRKIVVSSIEHKSVLLSAKSLSDFGFEIVELEVTSGGKVDLPSAEKVIDKDTLIVAVQYANNETGVIQPIKELVELAHDAGAFFHCDAVQGLGKAVLSLSELQVDSATFSAHKVHGPKGVGALFLRSGARKWPFEYPLFGGGQEQNIRPGTINVSGIVGLGKAIELMANNLNENISYMRSLQSVLEEKFLKNIPQSYIHGYEVERLPNTTNVYIPNVPADILMANLPLFCFSDGSACDSGAMGSSHVLRAMKVQNEKNNIRLSTSIFNTSYEIDLVVKEIILKIKSIKY